MTDWSEPFMEAENQMKLAFGLLSLGLNRKGYTALTRTIAHLEATRKALTSQPNCEPVRITKAGVKPA